MVNEKNGNIPSNIYVYEITNMYCCNKGEPYHTYTKVSALLDIISVSQVGFRPQFIGFTGVRRTTELWTPDYSNVTSLDIVSYSPYVPHAISL